MCMKALPDEEGIETSLWAVPASSRSRMKALPDEEGIETPKLTECILSHRYEGTP